MSDLFHTPKKNTKKSAREILLRVASADAVDGFVDKAVDKVVEVLKDASD